MNTTNKTTSKTSATKETTKIINKPIITAQSEPKKPTLDVKKPEVPEKAPIINDKEPIVPDKELGFVDQLSSVVTNPELTTTETEKVINKSINATQPELETQTVEINNPVVLEKAPFFNDKEPILATKESGEPDQLIPVDTKPEPAKTESTNSEKAKNPTKAEQAKAIYDEMVKDPNNDRTTIIAKIKKDLVLTKAGALSYFYKFQRESGNVTEKQPSKMDKAKEVYEKMLLEGQSRKDIIAAFVKEVELTPAGASTYYQNLKKLAEKPAKS